MKTRRMLAGLLSLILVLAGLMTAQADFSYQVERSEEFSLFLDALLEAFEAPSEENRLAIAERLKTIEAGSASDFEIAEAIDAHWQQVYLDPDYTLLLYPDGDSLAQLPIPDAASHAFVVLGFELKDGEMQDELKGRCEAAAAAAKAFPESFLVCSGGATGANNPEQHTEAGLMKAYLTEVCGISADRILTDDQAMTTAENAINTFDILKAQGLQTMTIVTSKYHQRWGQVLYNALSAIYRQREGYAPKIVGNYCYNIDTDSKAFQKDYRIALRQLSGILGIKTAGPGPSAPGEGTEKAKPGSEVGKPDSSAPGEGTESRP